MADPINILSLCSGVGMLDAGLHAGLEYLGFEPRVLGFCERDAYAASCLLARMEDQSMEPAPVFCGDMRDMDARPLRGYADLVCAGLPCQPYSCAGKQEGNSDRRSWGDGDGPIPHFLRIVSECRPAVVFLENVPAWVRGGWFRPVGEELCRMGFTLESPLFLAAEDVGASHRRERVFILAVCQGRRLRELRESSRRYGQSDRSGEQLADDPLTRSRRISKPDGRNDAADFNRSGQSLDDSAQQQQQQSGLRIGTESPYAGHRESIGDVGNAISPRQNADAAGCGSRSSTGESGGLMDDAASPRSARTGLGGIEGQATGDGEQAGMPGLGTGCRDVADASSSERRRKDARTGPEGRIAAGGASCDLADANSTGLRTSGERQGRASDIEQCGYALFAPGPGDLDGWNRVVADGSIDFRAPAIKPGVRVLADGLSLVVDQSRADQLRCGGNGCVPLCAAVAFVELFWRAMQ